jgi:invasion protein IalB
MAIPAPSTIVRQNALFRRMARVRVASRPPFFSLFYAAPRWARAIDKGRGLPDRDRVPENAAIRDEVDGFLTSSLLRFVAMVGLVAAGSLALMGPGLSQGVVKAQYGDWQMSCDTPPGASFEQCAIIQNVTAEDQPNVGLSVIVLKTADRQARLLRVLAPLGVLLPNGLGLNIDGADIGRVAFVRCLPNGCVAEVVLDDELIRKLSTGKNAIFVVFKTPEEGIGIPVSLNGFSDGFAQLP